MIQEYSRYRILQEFFDFPNQNLHMREISRNTKITQPSTSLHLKVLVKEGLILKEKKGLYPTYRANRDNELFKVYKRLNLILRIHQTKLLDYISDTCSPRVVILFGSASLGEDIETSDLDLFINSEKTELELEKYEKHLKRKINPFFEQNFARLSKELKNNLLNGIILKGYIKVY